MKYGQDEINIGTKSFQEFIHNMKKNNRMTITEENQFVILFNLLDLPTLHTNFLMHVDGLDRNSPVFSNVVWTHLHLRKNYTKYDKRCNDLLSYHHALKTSYNIPTSDMTWARKEPKIQCCTVDGNWVIERLDEAYKKDKKILQIVKDWVTEKEAREFHVSKILYCGGLDDMNKMGCIDDMNIMYKFLNYLASEKPSLHKYELNNAVIFLTNLSLSLFIDYLIDVDKKKSLEWDYLINLHNKLLQFEPYLLRVRDVIWSMKNTKLCVPFWVKPSENQRS